MLYTVTIPDVAPDPEVYFGLPRFKAFINSSFGPVAAKARALSDDDLSRLLFSCTQYIDSRPWDGAPAGTGGTTLAFPRTGGAITDDAATQLALVEKAISELGLAVVANPTLLSAADTGSNVKKVEADGSSVEFWQATSARDGTAPVMPPNVLRLIGKYAGSVSAANGGGLSFGTDGKSAFDRCDDTDRTDAF